MCKTIDRFIVHADEVISTDNVLTVVSVFLLSLGLRALQCRALGYLVVGLNEYYTSKKCPHCRNFVAQVTLRQLYCPHCKAYFHRDVMAGHNLCNVIDGYLLQGHRPGYLQPIKADGTFPWMRPEPSTSDCSSMESSSSSVTTRKRPRL